MTDTTFVDKITPISAQWLNDANDAIYGPYPVGTLGYALADKTTSTNGDFLLGVKSSYVGSVARTQHAKNEETTSLLDFLPAGYVTDGSVDYTAYVQAFFNAVTSNHVRGILPSIDIQISSTITVTGGAGTLSNFEICGIASDGAWASNGAFGCRFLWSGAGGTAFSLINCRDAKISGFFVVPKAANALTVGLDIDGANSTNLEITFVVTNGSGTLGTGIRLANTSTSGNDLHDFRRCYVNGATIGWDVRNGQSKLHRLYGCTFANCTTGINQVDGSFTLYNANFSHNGIDIVMNAPTDSISIYNPQSELSGRFFYENTQFSAGSCINVFGGRLRTSSGALNADGNYIKSSTGGPLNLIGVDFASGVYISNWRISCYNASHPTNSAALNMIGCQVPNSTLWASDNTLTATPKTVFGSRCINSDGTQSPIPMLIDGSQYDTTAGIIIASIPTTLAAGATNIDASLGTDFITVANGGATAIATITNARPGQTITIAGGSSTNATTIADAGVFKLTAAITLNANTTITLKTYDGTNWLELARAIN